jgi:hypothetical protein
LLKADDASSDRVVAFLKNPLFTTAAGILGSLVGVLFYAPSMILCSAGLTLALYETYLIRLKSRSLRTLICVIVFVMCSAGLIRVGTVVQRQTHIPTAPEIAAEIFKGQPPPGRTLGGWQQYALREFLRKSPGRVLFIVASGQEPWSYAGELRKVFLDASWTFVGIESLPPELARATDLQISINTLGTTVPGSAEESDAGFKKAGLKVREGLVFDNNICPDLTVVWIGAASPTTTSPNMFAPLSAKGVKMPC